MGKKYRSDALAAVHETALGLTEAGVMDKWTMKAFDDMCLAPIQEIDSRADSAASRK
jgi:putative transcriptional regulator